MRLQFSGTSGAREERDATLRMMTAAASERTESKSPARDILKKAEKLADAVKCIAKAVTEVQIELPGWNQSL